MASRIFRLTLIGVAVCLAAYLCRALLFADVQPISLVEDTETGWRLQAAASLAAIEYVAVIVVSLCVAFLMAIGVMRLRRKT